MFPFTNAAPSQPAPGPTPTPTPGPAPEPAPPVPTEFRDTLTVVPFTVPQSGAIIDVSGGGGALAGAVSGAGAGDTIRILDSLNYDSFDIMAAMDLSIVADDGQTPSITALPGGFEHCIQLMGPISGLRLKGITFIGNGNSGTHSSSDLQFLGMVFMSILDGGGPTDRIIIEDCTFSEPAATAGDSCPGVNFYGDGITPCDNLWIHRCSFLNTAAVTALVTIPWGAITVTGFTNVYIQNVKIVRQDAVLPAGMSNMKGVVVQNTLTIVEDVLCDWIGENFNPQAFLNAGLPGLPVGYVSVASFRNCVAYNCKIGYENGSATGTLTVDESVYDAATVAPGGVAMRRSTGAYTCRDCVLTAQGGGFTFSATGIVEDHNDVFNWGATGKVLDPTDQTIDPLYQDVPNRIFTATAPPLLTGASDGGRIGVRYDVGEVIFWVNTAQGS